MNDKIVRVMLLMFIIAAAVLGPRVSLCWAQIASPPPADHPEVTVHGRKFTPRSILARNMGTPEDQAAQSPPPQNYRQPLLCGDENPELISHCHIARQYSH